MILFPMIVSYCSYISEMKDMPAIMRGVERLHSCGRSYSRRDEAMMD